MSSEVDEHKVLDGQDQPQTKEELEHAAAAAEYSGVDQSGQLSMEVKVYSPFHDYYDGPAFSLSAENTTGPFDILPKHHNFISLLTPCDMVVRTVKNGDQKIRISGGVMHVKADKVIVFLDV
jgi:hypothetical protein